MCTLLCLSVAVLDTTLVTLLIWPAGPAPAGHEPGLLRLCCAIILAALLVGWLSLASLRSATPQPARPGAAAPDSGVR